MQLSISMMMRTITPMLIGAPFAMTEEDQALVEIARDILKLKLAKDLTLKPNAQPTAGALANYVVTRARAVFDSLFP